MRRKDETFTASEEKHRRQVGIRSMQDQEYQYAGQRVPVCGTKSTSMQDKEYQYAGQGDFSYWERKKSTLLLKLLINKKKHVLFAGGSRFLSVETGLNWNRIGKYGCC